MKTTNQLWSQQFHCFGRLLQETVLSPEGHSEFVSLPPEHEGIHSLDSSVHLWCTPLVLQGTAIASVASVTVQDRNITRQQALGYIPLAMHRIKYKQLRPLPEPCNKIIYATVILPTLYILFYTQGFQILWIYLYIPYIWRISLPNPRPVGHSCSLEPMYFAWIHLCYHPGKSTQQRHN